MPFFSSGDAMRRERQKLVDRDATLVAELAVRLGNEGVTIRHDVRWGHPHTDAILRKIQEVQPDLVMKQARPYSYMLGLFGNTDWDLVRRSPAHVWFVADEDRGIDSDTIERVLTAVGTDSEDDEMIGAGDYHVFGVAGFIARGFSAEHFAVHAYEVPNEIEAYAAYAPELGGAVAPEALTAIGQARRTTASRHGQSIEAFARHFDMGPDQVHLQKGRAGDVVPRLAEALDADLIVMSARNLSPWERLIHAVTAEPVIARAPCDVLFVKDERPRDEPTMSGEPAYDLERAIVDPACAFATPRALVQADDLSVALRSRLLEVWAQDVKAQMAEEDEGGPVLDTSAHLLEEIELARIQLESGAAPSYRPRGTFGNGGGQHER
jgi:universal stress protein E